ncbi:hypothetical protein [Hyphomicrobium sp. CS1GBMeth3]|uniref:hypothetical protein n=1 Tax=Hyphomicrobium sp. CS1GBMeth3 TaxID=1892845 RepID=UPI000B2C68DB|nr:hypothetical protein [Hyphomicrobium sp. CS1GBMeth3]
MKGYPATRRELEDLLGSGKEANRFYSWAAAFGGFALSGLGRLVLHGWNADVWTGFSMASLVFAVVLAHLGYKKKDDGQLRLTEIIDQTSHDESDV